MTQKIAHRAPRNFPPHVTVMMLFSLLHGQAISQHPKKEENVPEALHTVRMPLPITMEEEKFPGSMREYDHSQFLEQMARISFTDSRRIRFVVTKDGVFLHSVRSLDTNVIKVI